MKALTAARRRRLTCSIMLLGLACSSLLVACGGGSSSEAPPPELVGPIPAAEFASVPPPNYAQLETAYRAVLGANPALLNDEPALSRALFDEVKRTSRGQGGEGGTRKARREELFDPQARLTPAEWRLVVQVPARSYVIAGTIQPANEAALRTMPCDADIGFADGKADAVRHAYWSALMARRTSAALALAFGNAHEAGSSNTPAASAMDLHNNAVGRALAEAYPTASEAQLLELIAQQRFTLVIGGVLPAGTSSLVYIAPAARRAFDASYAGSFTDPGSGAPWSAVVDVNQCGSVVRGRFTLVRGNVTQVRRFSGVATGETQIDLQVADPFAFEDVGVDAPCLAMAVRLTGSLQALSGPWIAGNCPLGGMFTFARQ